MNTTYTELANPEYLKALIEQEKRLNPDKYIILTESKGDNKVYEEVLNDLPVIVLYAVGKDKCLKAIKLANDDNELDCAAVVDSDFDKFKNIKYDFNVFITDYPDIECYTIHSIYWKKVLQEIINLDKLRKVKCQNLEDFREKIIELSLAIGILKFIIKNDESLSFSLKKYKYDKASKVLPKLDNSLKKVINRIEELNKSKDWSKKEEIIKLAEDIFSNLDSGSKKHLLNSNVICKCVVDIINGVGLGNKLSGLKNISDDGLRRIFRTNVNKQLFHKSKLYENICKWINTPPNNV